KTGRWDEAVSLATQLLERSGASPINRLNPLISLGRVRARRGEPGVWKCLDEVRSAADAVDEPGWIVLARLACAEARWLEGDTAAAAHEQAVAERAVAGCGAMLRGQVAAWRHRLGGPVRQQSPLVEPYASQVAGDWARAAQLW